MLSLKKNSLTAAILSLSVFAHARTPVSLAAKNANENQLLFLNASNFDFTDNLTAKYLGHININATDLNDSRWGVNTGIMKLNYFADDSVERKVYENVWTDPLSNMQAGSTYYYQLNRYNIKNKRTNWSFYVQPLYRLTNAGQLNNIYLHGHMELLVNRVEQTTHVTNIAQDTLTYNNQPGFVARRGIDSVSTYKKVKPNGYFGLGLTFNICPWDNGYLFFQATAGVTSDNPVQFLTPADRQATNNWNYFYLFRAYYSQRLSESTLIVIGTDIRGLFPRYDPLYAAYVGVNLNIDQLVH